VALTNSRPLCKLLQSRLL